MKKFALLFLCGLTVMASSASAAVRLAEVEFPIGKTVEVPLAPQDGAPQAKVHAKITSSKSGLAAVNLHYEKLEPAVLYGGDVTTYVLWAITQDGAFYNLGEVQAAKRSGSEHFSTGMKSFALLMTAEPYYLVSRPSALVTFVGGTPKDKKFKSRSFEFDSFAAAPIHERSDITGKKWESKESLELLQARTAYQLAKENQAATYAPDLYKAAGAQLKEAEANSKKHHKKMLDAARESIQMSNEAIQVSAKSIAAIALAEIIEARRAEMEALVERSEADEMMIGTLLAANANLESEASWLRNKLAGALAEIAETRIDAAGVILTLPDILFAVDKATLTDEAELSLAKLAGVMLAVPECGAVVTGYTDSTGTDDVNMRLSLGRADSVAEFLSSEGVDPGRLEAVGLGSQFPVADNSTPQGRKQNRRVEILISM